MTFKIGDKVEVVEKYDSHEVGEVGTITSMNDFYYRINGDKWGARANKFKKVEDKPMFKVGDKVKVLNKDHDPVHYYKIGSVVEVTAIKSNGDLFLKGNPETDGASRQTVNPKCVGIDGIFEDEWHLNNGKVTIPDDAHKLMDGGSVVAFRKRKTPPLQFGDKVMCEGELCIYLRKDRINDALVVLARENEFNISRHLSKITKV